MTNSQIPLPDRPTATRSRSLRLVQFTDTHLLPEPDGTLRGARTLPRLKACLAHARRHYFPVDAIAVTGDLVHDDPAGYDALGRVFGDLGVPVLLVPGNHDVPGELRRKLGHAPFQVGGEFRSGPGWQVILLESWYAESRDGEGRLGAAQLDALRRALAEATEPHAFVFVHHPPLSMDAPALDALGLVDAPAFLAAVVGHPRVRGVCWGHAHQSLDVYHDAIRWMCTPATSMQFRPRRPRFEADDRPPGYRVLDLRDDGSIATEVVWLEGYQDPE